MLHLAALSATYLEMGHTSSTLFHILNIWPGKKFMAKTYCKFCCQHFPFNSLCSVIVRVRVVLKELLLVTRVLTTWVEVPFRVKWVVFVRQLYNSGLLKLIGQFSHDSIGWKTSVKFFISHRWMITISGRSHYTNYWYSWVQTIYSFPFNVGRSTLNALYSQGQHPPTYFGVWTNPHTSLCKRPPNIPVMMVSVEPKHFGDRRSSVCTLSNR